VLDIDPRHDGDETLAQLEKEHGDLPLTWRFLTGGGGEHILFRHPGGIVPNSAGKIGEGIDVRGDGGYIVAPPSQHILGRPYAISVDHHPDMVELAGAPAWLLEIIHPLNDSRTATRTGVQARGPGEWRHLTSSLVSEGQRNATMARLTGHLLRRYIDPFVTLELLQAWNLAHCHPPLPADEVLRTVQSIAAREIERRQRHDAR
jgi:putative DNA primase/helicase